MEAHRASLSRVWRGRRRLGWASTLGRDVVAGMTVAFVLIPQALAYAGVAGMPPISGLYAAALPPLAASFFVSSPYLQTGPVAQTSLLTFGALASLAPVGSSEYVQLGMMLALLIGVVRILLGVTRAGFIAHLMSEPMLMGFVPAGAILILLSQLPAALGREHVDGSVVAAAARTAVDPGTWTWSAIALGLGAIAIIYAGRRVHRLFPGVLLALGIGLLIGATGDFGGAPVGHIPGGLPSVHLDLLWGHLPELLLSSVVIAIVGFAEPASIARTYATRERQAWNADREFVSQGVANVASAFTGGYPVGGSFSRTALNYTAGAASRVSGAVTGLVVLAFLPFASVLAALPKSVLAAIVISAVLGLLRLGRLARLWSVSRAQFAVAVTTFVLTLLLAPHIERAVLIGVALSLVVHLTRQFNLRIDVSLKPDCLEIRPAGTLWFGNAQRLEERLLAVLEAHPDVPHVRLILAGLGGIDITGAMALHNLIDDASAAGLTVELRDVPPQTRMTLDRYATQRARLA